MLARVERLIGWRQIAGPLVRRYIVLFLAVVFVVLLANSLLEIGFFYRDHNSLLIRAQREQAEAAAAKIGQFIREIESQLGWTTQLPWSTGTIDQRPAAAVAEERCQEPGGHHDSAGCRDLYAESAGDLWGE